jgi:predicted TIM-barrel fold metal-dependent hydrolase
MSISDSLGYALIDADNHFYETPDCFSRHIEAKHADKAITAAQQADGSWEVKVGHKPYNFMDVKFDRTNRPGSMHEILRAKDSTSDLKWGDSYSKENMLAAFQQRGARLATMENQGIEAIIVLPTFAVSVEAMMLDDPEQLYANYRSFNRWLEEEWTYGQDGRIFAPPLLSLLDLPQALAELDRVMEAGARIVHLTPGPIGNGTSPADPMYDPFWARLNEAGVLLALHIADSRYPEVSDAWGEPSNPPVREMTAFQWAFVHGDRPIMETFGQLIYGNVFGRFPKLRAVSLENGSDWVPYLLTLMDKKKGMGRYSRWIGGRPAGRPSDIFRRHCYVSPYPEDDVDALVDCIGASQVLFGSDYPHPEGLAEPWRFAELMQRSTAEDVRLVMRDNAAGLLGLEP